MDLGMEGKVFPPTLAFILPVSDLPSENFPETNVNFREELIQAAGAGTYLESPVLPPPMYPAGGTYGELAGLAREYDVTRLASPVGSRSGSPNPDPDHEHEERKQRSYSGDSTLIEPVEDCPPKFLIDHVQAKMKKNKDKIKDCSKLFLSLQSKTVLWRLVESLLVELSADPVTSEHEQARLRELYCAHRPPESVQEKRAFQLLRFLERRQRDQDDFFFAASPAGEIPLHLFFLLDVHVLCADVIREIYTHRVTIDESGHEIRCVDVPIKSHLRWLDTLASLGEGGHASISNAAAISSDSGHELRLASFVGLPSKLREWKRKGWIPSEKEWQDMGLYTGQTVLHMAIVNRRCEAVRSLLESARASLHARATGLFFQPQILPPFRKGERSRFSHMLSQNMLAWAFNGVSMLKNKKSVFYGGEYPLSFAASVGALEIMKCLVDCAEARGGEKERERLLEAQDSLGNTALHMAVYHSQTEALDWLIKNGGRKSLFMLNVMGCTPFTASAYTGNAAMFMHILRTHMSRPLWRYGEMSCIEIEMGQLDSFRLQKVEGHRDADPHRRLSTPLHHVGSTREGTVVAESLDKRFSKWTLRRGRRAGRQNLDSRRGGADLERMESLPASRVGGLLGSDGLESMPTAHSDGFGRAPSVEEEEKADERMQDAVASLHNHPDWRSALEIIITHHVEAMTDPENKDVSNLIKALVHEKWKRFAGKIHWKHRCIPYVAFVAFFSFMFCWHCSVLRQKHMGDEGLVQADWTQRRRREVWGMEAAVVFFATPWLLYSAYQGIKCHLVHLDVNMDGDLGGEEIIIFMYKNMQAVGDIVTTVGVACCVIARIAGDADAEIAFYVITVVVIWANCLSLMLPNSFLGSLTFMIYRMLVGDVFKFLVIYILLVFGFGLALFGLLQGGDYPREQGDQEDLGCINCDIYFGNIVLSLVYVSMGEVDQTGLLARMHLPFLATGLFIIYAVLSLLLLLNLIIAMMGDTYHRASRDMERDWFWPYATLVLQYERQTTSSQKRKYRLGHSSESHSEDGDKAYSPMHYYHEIRTAEGQYKLESI